MLLEWLVELKENIDRHGVRWGIVFALYAVYRKERRNYRLDQRDKYHNAYFAAILENQRVIMKKLGVEGEWSAEKIALNANTGPMRSKGSWMDMSLVRSVTSFIRPLGIVLYTLFMRGMRKVQLSKSWVIAVLIFIGAEINRRWGVQLPDGWEELAYTFIQGGAILAAMILNAIKHRPQPEEVKKAIQEAPQTYKEMYPYLKEVNDSVNQMLAQIQSGKYSDATKEAMETYMEIHELLTRKKGA